MNSTQTKAGFKQEFFRNILNLPGYKTYRKIIVIESDDWGCIRMSSKESFNYFTNKNIPVNKCPYNSFDAIESNEDLELLFEVLSSVKDNNGNPAVITANNITANPDFDRIKSNKFKEYFYEPFTETLKKYPHHDKVYELYKDGIKNKIFIPQFHGREHVNIFRWMNALKNNDKSAHLAFERNMFSMHIVPQGNYIDEYMDALGSKESLEEQKRILSEGLNLFENLWGYKSKSFIAPSYIWDSSLEETLFKEDVRYIQGISVQMKPISIDENLRKKTYHYQGQKNKLGQRYLVRNAFFEPALNPDFDSVSECMNRIKIAFKWNKPATICSHRLNYIGFINLENRDKNLKLLSGLLKNIKNEWPDVEFMSSDMLGDTMGKSN